MNCLILVVLAAIATLAIASSDVKVIVYNGPKQCSNKIKGDEKLAKVEPDHVVGLHFTVTVDENSSGSRESLGKKIESSRDLGIAPSFPVGQGKVIAGLDQGLIGLCRGASAYIIVPPHLAYGHAGKPEQGVGSDATLRYDVEIVDIQPPVPNDFVKIDTNKDWKISRDEGRKYFEGIGQSVNYLSLWEDEDKDGDGYISWEEFTGPKGNERPPQNPKKQQQKQPRDQQQQQQQQQDGQVNDITALFQKIDADKDGKISKVELVNTFKALEQEMTEEFWAESDPDGDGYVLFEEFIGSDNGKQAGKGDEM